MKSLGWEQPGTGFVVNYSIPKGTSTSPNGPLAHPEKEVFNRESPVVLAVDPVDVDSLDSQSTTWLN